MMKTRSTFQFLRIALGLVLLCSLVLGEVTPASAALRCYVKANAAGSNNGTSWANAYKSLQPVLSSASACTEVWVAKGTYKPTSTTNRAVSFSLKSGVALYGGFAGNETLLSQRKPAMNATILSGEIGAAGTSDNSYHVVIASGTDSTARLDGFTITGGNANGTSSPQMFGGGLFSNAGSPSLKNLVVKGNSAQDGGGMYIMNTSSPSLVNVTFSGNLADYGSGMYNWQSNPSLTNVTFSGNSATYYGGGMYNNDSDPNLVNVTFTANSADLGSAMLNYYNSNPDLRNTTLSGNSANPGGSALYNTSNSSATITNSILYGDTGGEIYYTSGSTAVVSSSIVQGGYAGTGNLDADPLLKPLANNGGFTRTMALGYGSPAIDSGTSTACPAKDQRGLPRPQDGDNNSTATCDRGATEARFSAGRCYVNVRAAGFNDGMTWQDAYRDLQSALGSSPCTEVWVAKGTYKPTSGTDRTVSFVLKNGVALYGGFAGNEMLLTQRKPLSNPTILSGSLSAVGNADNSYHVVVGSGTNSTARLDGFTITAGNANAEASPDWFGGGMYNEAGSPSLVNLTFSGSSATKNGGGMYNVNSSPSLMNVTFSNNSTTEQDGGGMYNENSSPSLTNVTFRGNSAAEAGGGMSNSPGNPRLTNVTFSGNSGYTGGGMYNYFSNPNLVNVTFSGNHANTAGGGIYNSDSNPSIKNSILYADTGGEIYNANSSSPLVTYSIVQGGFPGTGNLNANPLLKTLANNGGFTETMLLGIGSPAIDKGTNTGCPAKDQRGKARPQDGDANGTAICDMGATESPRLLAASFQSAGAQDGVIQESNEDSGVGGVLGAVNLATFAMGDDEADRQGRSILSFNTAGLPANATIASVTLKIKKAGLVGTDPFLTHGNILVDVRKGPFASNSALQIQDFQALASKNAAMTILNNPVNGWYSGAMTAANLIYINKVGLTQFRLRFQTDDNDDLSADYLKFYSGNYATAAYRPTLIIKYYMP